MVLKFSHVAPLSRETAEESLPRLYPLRVSSPETWFHTHSRSSVPGIRRSRGGEFEAASSVGLTAVQLMPSSRLTL